MAPQLNTLRSRVAGEELQATPRGTTYQKVVETFGLPILVHVEGQLCKPWDSCQYEAMNFMYRSRESWTCKVTFAKGAMDRDVECVPELVHLILGPGDVDPRSGRTAESEPGEVDPGAGALAQNPKP